MQQSREAKVSRVAVIWDRLERLRGSGAELGVVITFVIICHKLSLFDTECNLNLSRLQNAFFSDFGNSKSAKG
jgi:hypothetical protein